MRRAQLRILFHGLIVLLAGLFCGVPYGKSITGGWGEEAERAWRLAHFSLVVGGIWLMAVAAAAQLLVLSSRNLAILVVALVVAAMAGVRGLEPSGSALNLVAFLANVIASLASLVWLAVMLLGTIAALRDADQR